MIMLLHFPQSTPILSDISPIARNHILEAQKQKEKDIDESSSCSTHIATTTQSTAT